MARQLHGTVAEYSHETECTWVTATNLGTLSSGSFGSCAGLVLWEPKHSTGMVAHFSGSMRPAQVREDTLEIMRTICPIGPGYFKAWVFGGVSLQPKSEHGAMTMAHTKKMIDAIKGALNDNPWFDVNDNYPKTDKFEMMMTQEMQLHKKVYVGHSGVALDVQTGQVSWEDSVQKKRRGSLVSMRG
ncbi:hypothetical protein [Thalassomonas actiniarum]|uniref:Uncharacterized protein n=1 Tax=Thalassomonas actiniarum TaxID=485447 RepID=A0AAE9YTV1_9GAMM|nr:hypothetical protein [Thalassomonas actiniarum]WDE00170.1 hypothetical protein SG35_005830 [Thalassomonas actiniarum]